MLKMFFFLNHTNIVICLNRKKKIKKLFFSLSFITKCFVVRQGPSYLQLTE